MAEDPNYGMYREHGTKSRLHRPEIGVDAPAERTWSALAHLSIFLNLFTGFLGPAAAFVIWLVYRNRSERVAFHAMQSLWYQVAWLVIITSGWTVTGILTLVPFVHAAYAAYKVNQGADYNYLCATHLLKGRKRLSGPLGHR